MILFNRVFTKTEIGAPAEVVWTILTDFDKYPEWNPFIVKIKGSLEKGSRLTVLMSYQNGKKQKFARRLKKIVRNSELGWQGYVFMPGLFDGEHVFVVEKLSKVKTLFMHSETFTGLLCLFILPLIRKKTQKSFENMNKALKIRAESWHK